MAVFDESKVINPLHPEKAEVGKKYWRSDNLLKLKVMIEKNNTDHISELVRVAEQPYEYPFQMEDGCDWQFLYPYEESPKKRMTNRQLARWLAYANGQVSTTRWDNAYMTHDYEKVAADEEVPNDYVIRPWDSDTWIEPAEEIYLRDC